MTRWRKLGIALAALIAVAVAVLLAAGEYLSTYAHRQLIEVLRERYQSDVKVRSTRVSLLPPFGAALEGLEFRHHGRTDVPPLISIGRATATIGIAGLLQRPKRVREVRLEGLQIHIPPRGEQKAGDERARPGRPRRSPFVIEHIVADGTTLWVLPRRPGKQPLEFDIRRLRLRHVGIDRPMNFDAELQNAKPPGAIRSHGRFGPWAAADPGDSPVSGDYTFENADLSVFRGIRGILSSQGSYRGKLERIDVQGATDTPDFTVSGQPVHLKTEFSATVDGTDGDTYLHPVTAHFLRSTVVASGSIAGTPGVKGKTVSLDATMDGGRIEDILRLAVKSDPPALTGGLSFRSKMLIPPGDADVIEKLYLKGTFGVGSGRFTGARAREKIETLSRRARGDTGAAVGEGVASNFNGAFVLRNGTIDFSRLRFTIPGAAILLAGNYGIRSGEIDLRGRARLDAKPSEMTTGVKSFFLKLADPLFKRKDNRAGSEIPIRIQGTREHPSAGLDAGKVLK